VKRVTSFSFKGGAGRTVSTANIAAALAAAGKRVVVADLDIEAPGLHYVFEIEDALEGATVFLQTYLREDAELHELLDGGAVLDVNVARVSSGLEPYEFSPGGELWYVGSQSSDVTLPMEDGFMDVYSALVRLTMHFADEGFDYFMMDAPSGFGALAALALELSDTEDGVILWFLRMSAQHVRGTVLMGGRLADAKRRGKFPHTTFHLVAAAVPQEEEIERIDSEDVRCELLAARNVARQALKRLSDLSPTVEEIPELLEFKWKERVIEGPALLDGPFGRLASLLEAPTSQA